MAKDAYTLKKHEDTGELHLFKGKMLPNDPKYKCDSQGLSICERMEKKIVQAISLYVMTRAKLEWNALELEEKYAVLV